MGTGSARRGRRSLRALRLIRRSRGRVHLEVPFEDIAENLDLVFLLLAQLRAPEIETAVPLDRLERCQDIVAGFFKRSQGARLALQHLHEVPTDLGPDQ